MKRRCYLLCGLLFAALPAWPQDRPPDLLTYGIVGNASSQSPAENPSVALASHQVQQLMLDLARQPADPTAVGSALAGSKVSASDLVSAGLLRREGNHYVVNFTLFTAADLEKVRPLADRYASALAREYLAHRPEFERTFAGYDLAGIDRREVAFLLLGCFSLDWDGLRLTAEKGYRATAPVRTNGDRFFAWAEERTSTTLKEMYWGSHNAYYPASVLTSFGDHYSLPRNAFPDLLWQMSRVVRVAAQERTTPPELNALWTASSELLGGKVGAVMLALRRGPRTSDELARSLNFSQQEIEPLLELLDKTGYVRQQNGRYAAAIPVLDANDKAMIDRIVGLSAQVMSAWLAANYDSIRRELKDTTPLRYGVPYPQVFTQVWHYIFGATNRELVHAGLFTDPYAGGRSQGFVPVVWDPTVYRDH